MAPSTSMQKVLKDARKQQRAFGPCAWSAPFPHEKLDHVESRVTKVTNIIKVRPKPSNILMELDAINKKYEQSTTTKAQSTLLMSKLDIRNKLAMSKPKVQNKPVSECKLQHKAAMPPCISQGKHSMAATRTTTEATTKLATKPTTKPTIKLATKPTTKPPVAKRTIRPTIRRVAKPVAGFRPLPRDSHSPLTNIAPIKPMGHKNISSAPKTSPCLKSSSSSPTSAKGVHLLLAVVPIDHFELWLEDWKAFCSLSDDHISAYYNSIERVLESTGLQIYADCDNKTLAELLKNKVTGEEVFCKQLICKFI